MIMSLPTSSTKTRNDVNKLLDDLDKRRRKTLRNAWREKLAEGLAGTDQEELKKYAKDPLGLAQKWNITLTPDQQKLLLAILEYEAVVVISATGVGKTFVLAFAAIWLYKCHDDVEIYTAAAPPEKNLKLLLWGEIGRFVNNNKDLFLDDTATTLRITRGPKNHIEGVTIPTAGKPEDLEAKFSGKHQRNLVFVFDEGDAIPDPVYRGADGCMSGGEFVRQVISYNPKKKEGEPYRMIQENRAHVITMTAFNHPNVRTGRNVVPGAVTREATVRRINEWSTPLPPEDQPDSNCFHVPQFLVGEIARAKNGREYLPLPAGWRKITDQQLAYKVLGRYPAEGENQLIAETWITNARARHDAYVAQFGKNPPGGTSAIMGQDVADMGPDHNITLFRYGGYIDIYDRWNGVDPGITATRAAKNYKDVNPIKAFVDAIGVGAAVPGTMGRLGCRNVVRVNVGEKSTGFTEDGEFNLIRDEAYWNIRVWLKDDPGAMLPDNKRLLDALRIVTYDVTKNIKVMDKQRMIKLLNYSPDEMEALMLTFAPANVWMGAI